LWYAHCASEKGLADIPSRLRLKFRYAGGVTLKAIIHNAEEGGFWAEVPALPGCMTQGESLEEIEANVREAIEGWLSVDLPESVTAEDRVIEISV
jgi:predicted RNase H-like HicB family nuclease